jgi:cell division topological specificity factor
MNFQKLIDYFRGTPPKTASLAKERLQIVISHERAKRHHHPHDDNFLRLLQQELMAVISKYFPVDEEQVKVELARTGDLSILELNVTLPDGKSSTTPPPRSADRRSRQAVTS